MLRCPSCARRHEVKPRFIGRTIDCERCGETFVLQSETNARKFRARKQRSRQRTGKLIRNLNSLDAENKARKRIVVSPAGAAEQTRLVPSKKNKKKKSKFAQIPKQDDDQKWVRRGMMLAMTFFVGAFLFFGFRLVTKNFPYLGRLSQPSSESVQRIPATEQMAMHKVDTESTLPAQALTEPEAISFLGFEASEVAFRQYMVLTTNTKQTKNNLLAYSPDGQSIALDGPDCVQVFSAKTGIEFERYPNKGKLNGKNTQFAFSDDSQKVYMFGPRFTGADGTGPQSNYELVTYERGPAEELKPAESTKVNLWDHRNHKLTVVGSRVFCSNGMVEFAGKPEHIPFEGFFCEDIAPDGTLITYNRANSSDSFHGAVSAWNVAVAPTNRFTSVVFPHKHYGGVRTELALAFSPDSQKALMGLEMDSAFSVLDLKTGDIIPRELRLLSGEHIFKFLVRLDTPRTMAMHPSGRVVAIERNFGDGKHWVALIDADEAILIGGLSFDQPIVNLAFNPDGNSLAILTRSVSGTDVSLRCAVLDLVKPTAPEEEISHLAPLSSLFSNGERLVIEK